MVKLRSELVRWAAIGVLWTAPAVNGQTNRQTSGSEPPPSWNDGSARRSVLAFVARVTTATSPDFVPVSERIATFDNDGTLWVEQPIYAEFAFALDRVRELAPKHPEWKQDPALAAVLRGDWKALEAAAERGLLQS